MKLSLKNWVLIIALPIMVAACGGSASTSGVSLSTIPDPTSALSSSSSGSAMILADAIEFAATTDAPTMKEIGDAVNTSYTALDTYFWGGSFIQSHQGGGSFTGHCPSDGGADQSTAFWSGQNKCYVFQGIGYAANRIKENTNTLCYMKGIASGPSGVSVTSGDVGIGNVFDQQSGDRLVKINVTNNPHGAGTMTVFVNIKGTNSVTDDVYSFDLYMCDGSTLKQNESYTITHSTNHLTAEGLHNEGGGQVDRYTLDAYLTHAADGSIIYDTAQPRTVFSHGSGTWGTYKGSVSVSDDQLETKSWNLNSGSQEGKSYIIASFSGDAENGIRIAAAATKGYWTDGTWSNTNTAGMEYNSSASPKFEDLSTGSLYSSASSFNFGTDSFFDGSLAAPTISMTGNCSATPDVTLDMDFAQAGVAAVGDACETNHFSHMDLCWANEVQNAMTNYFSACH